MQNFSQPVILHFSAITKQLPAPSHQGMRRGKRVGYGLLLFAEAVLRGRYAEMFAHVGAEMAHVREAHACRDLLDAEVGALQVVAYLLDGVLRHPFRCRLVRVFQAEHGEVLGRDGELAGIVGDG